MNDCDDTNVIRDVFSRVPRKSAQEPDKRGHNNSRKQKTAIAMLYLMLAVLFAVMGYEVISEYLKPEPLFPFAL